MPFCSRSSAYSSGGSRKSVRAFGKRLARTQASQLRLECFECSFPAMQMVLFKEKRYALQIIGIAVELILQQCLRRKENARPRQLRHSSLLYEFCVWRETAFETRIFTESNHCCGAT